MRWLMIGSLVAILAGSGLWVLGAHSVKTGMDHWAETRRAEGWQAEYAALDVTGYPLRFRAAFTDLALADPETGLAWQAAAFETDTSALRPSRVRVLWPGTQYIATPLEKIGLSASPVQGLLHLSPGPSLELAKAEMVFNALSLASDRGWQASVGAARFSAVRTGPATYATHASATGMRLPSRAVGLLDDNGVLPDLFEGVEITATLTFDRPWDRRAIEERRPHPTGLALTRLEAQCGSLALAATGTVAIAPDGIPSGEIALRATNWQEMLRVAVSAGALPESAARQMEKGLGLLAGLSGRSDTLDAPLRFSGGRIWLGPIPLGKAPALRLR
ncbi:hypothetical protein C8N32_103236 [Rhodovulum imhoffii]|uniref:DUF2125 domain-containing protein n=1 Tax=Rhodovulum imhoffii TaxID=365340 RepID=A0A2T5BV89_9RHOB|nr:DUF2125 domain-containing protein [Rhodovulum imhoffii]PTN03392.1 hypothetical protein C8N32_103236 [Rhodovulum imhoffii]